MSKPRIWEDKVSLNILSVLGYIINNDGEVVGTERTKVLVKLLPSIHTLSHRAILSLLISQLNDTDAKTFYEENGLQILNEWLVQGLDKQSPGISKEKQRIEVASQVRALLRILDGNVQTDAARQQHSYLAKIFPPLLKLLESGGAGFTADWSRVNIYRRHFDATLNQPAVEPPKQVPPTMSKLEFAEQPLEAPIPRKPGVTSTTPSPKNTANTSTTNTSNSTSTTSKPSPASILSYQAKTFLQTENPKQDNDSDYLSDDSDSHYSMGRENVITNEYQSSSGLPNVSIDHKIRQLGHSMQYAERAHCPLITCRRMAVKRCEYCGCCVKCGQKDRCEANQSRKGINSQATNGESGESNTTSNAASSAGDEGNSIGNASNTTKPIMSSSHRTQHVLGGAMDRAIYSAFKESDFYSVFSLIQNGTDVNFQRSESDMSTALMAAARHGREDAAKKLLSLGANPCLTDASGANAAGFAKRFGHLELEKLLLKEVEEWEAKHKEENSGDNEEVSETSISK